VCSGDAGSVFTDEDVVRRLRMRPPLIWDIARALRTKNMLDPALPLPRDRDSIIGQIYLRDAW